MLDNMIYVVDDNQAFLESTAWMLEGEGYQVESFSDPVTLLTELKDNPVQNSACILMDVRMPEMSGLDLHDQLVDSAVNIPVVYMTGHGDVSLAVEAMKKGAITFLEKPLDIDSLENALEAAFNKADTLRVEQQDGCSQGQNELKERLKLLTPREKDVADGVVSGKLNKIIAYDLGISIKTVELHRSRVMSKMHAKNAADLVKMVLTGSSI